MELPKEIEITARYEVYRSEEDPFECIAKEPEIEMPRPELLKKIRILRFGEADSVVNRSTTYEQITSTWTELVEYNGKKYIAEIEEFDSKVVHGNAVEYRGRLVPACSTYTRTLTITIKFIPLEKYLKQNNITEKELEEQLPYTAEDTTLYEEIMDEMDWFLGEQE